MNNERFFNAYVELLTSTLHDALNKNIVFQAQAKVNGEDQEELRNNLKRLEDKLQQFQSIEQSISEKESEIGRLKTEFEHAKSESAHLNTFRNELISARQEIEKKNNEIKDLVSGYESKLKELYTKIEYLQMTPAQRKKLDAKQEKEQKITNSDVKDGGDF